MLLECMHVCKHIQVEFTLVDSDVCRPPLKWAQGLINKTFSVQRSLSLSLFQSHILFTCFNSRRTHASKSLGQVERRLSFNIQNLSLFDEDPFSNVTAKVFEHMAC